MYFSYVILLTQPFSFRLIWDYVVLIAFVYHSCCVDNTKIYIITSSWILSSFLFFPRLGEYNIAYTLIYLNKSMPNQGDELWASFFLFSLFFFLLKTIYHIAFVYLPFIINISYEAQTRQKGPGVGVGHVPDTDTPQTRLHACPWGVWQIKNIFLIPILRGHSNNTVAT